MNPYYDYDFHDEKYWRNTWSYGFVLRPAEEEAAKGEVAEEEDLDLPPDVHDTDENFYLNGLDTAYRFISPCYVLEPNSLLTELRNLRIPSIGIGSTHISYKTKKNFIIV
jgi:hypothetical protein